MGRGRVVWTEVSQGPNFELRVSSVTALASLFDRYHPYHSTGNFAVYAFAVVENEKPIAGYLWQPPPPGSAKSVCPALPAGVLSLSRMVATSHDERRLRHISKPLRWQMRNLIDRTRWPVLVTYSDESVGHVVGCSSAAPGTECACPGPFHTGHVYKCSGWQKTKRRKAPTLTTLDGRRVSTYCDGKQADHAAAEVIRGHAWLQRWEHWGGALLRRCRRAVRRALGSRADRGEDLAIGQAGVSLREEDLSE